MPFSTSTRLSCCGVVTTILAVKGKSPVDVYLDPNPSETHIFRFLGPKTI